MVQISTSSGNTPLVVFRPHSEFSRLTPRQCWCSLGSPARLNNKNNDIINGYCGMSDRGRPGAMVPCVCVHRKPTPFPFSAAKGGDSMPFLNVFLNVNSSHTLTEGPWLPFVDHFAGQFVLNLLLSPGISNHLHPI